jgi:hypothetical protein
VESVLLSPLGSIPLAVRVTLQSEGLSAPIVGIHSHAVSLGAENTGQYVAVRILKADGPTLRGVAVSLSSIAEFSRFLKNIN